MKSILSILVFIVFVSPTFATLAPISGGIMSPTCAYGNTYAAHPTSGGTWSSSNTAVATINSGGTIFPLTPGTTIITYTVGTEFVTQIHTVQGPARIDSMSTTYFCSGYTYTFTSPTPGYVWHITDPTIGTINPLTGVLNTTGSGFAVVYYEDIVTGCLPSYSLGWVHDSCAPASNKLLKHNLQSITLFPNPANNELNIEWQNLPITNGNLTISDITGRVVFNTEIKMLEDQGSSHCDISQLISGLYIVKIQSGNYFYHEKIQVVH